MKIKNPKSTIEELRYLSEHICDENSKSIVEKITSTAVDTIKKFGFSYQKF